MTPTKVVKAIRKMAPSRGWRYEDAKIVLDYGTKEYPWGRKVWGVRVIEGKPKRCIGLSRESDERHAFYALCCDEDEAVRAFVLSLGGKMDATAHWVIALESLGYDRGQHAVESELE